MLVTTSFIYVLLNGLNSFTYVAIYALKINVPGTFIVIVDRLYTLVFAYNFYVYLITGKQFRSELHKLFCSCCPSSSCSSSSAHDDVHLARHGQADTAV